MQPLFFHPVAKVTENDLEGHSLLLSQESNSSPLQRSSVSGLEPRSLAAHASGSR